MCKKKYTIRATALDKKGRIIAVAYNDYKKSHPKQKNYAIKVGMEEKTFLHAEINAIIKSGNKKIHKIKVERYDAMGNPKNATPCPICSLAIKDAGIKFVEHTLD